MSEALKYLIVDDDEIDRLTIESYAAAFPFLHKVASCSNAVEASEFIHRFPPDIVFADIEMPGITGIELIRNFSGSIAAPVFTTSHPEFAVDGYELAAFDYLLKPVSKERFAKCVQRLEEFFQLRTKAFSYEKESESNFIIVKEGYDKYKISIHDIQYLEAMKDYTKLVMASNHYLILETLTGMHERLPAADFIRVHRSYVVNRQRVTAIKGNKINVQKHEVPVGKMYKKVVDEMFV